jgi:hypothetical protein
MAGKAIGSQEPEGAQAASGSSGNHYIDAEQAMVKHLNTDAKAM